MWTDIGAKGSRWSLISATPRYNAPPCAQDCAQAILFTVLAGFRPPRPVQQSATTLLHVNDITTTDSEKGARLIIAFIHAGIVQLYAVVVKLRNGFLNRASRFNSGRGYHSPKFFDSRVEFARITRVSYTNYSEAFAIQTERAHRFCRCLRREQFLFGGPVP